MSEINLPYVMSRLRELLAECEAKSPDWRVAVRVTYRHRDGGTAMLEVGSDEAATDDE